MSAHLCIHIANLFYLGSYLCRDILWLRVLTCAGLLFGIFYFCNQAEAMFAPASWMGVFLVVNLGQIGLTIRERRLRRLSPTQEEISALLLQRLTRQDMLNILTKSICESERKADLLEHSEQIELDKEQQFVRDVAFERLTDAELMNLIVRRFWRTIRETKPGWFRNIIARHRRRRMVNQETSPELWRKGMGLDGKP